MPETVDHVAKRLRTIVRGYGELLVAYSGGVDSALVLKVAHDELGENVTGVTADSPALPRAELDAAIRIARSFGARHVVISTQEIDDPDYAANPPDRCYHCKSELYRRLATVARQTGIGYLANGTNVDDLGDYRPGLQAAAEFRVVSPLLEAGLGKADVRRLARGFGVEVWNKPASPCLASRIPYGSAVTRDKLLAIERAEAWLRALGFAELRVRHFDTRARVEVPATDLAALRAMRDTVCKQLNVIGFQDVEFVEFRSGALNAALGNAG